MSFQGIGVGSPRSTVPEYKGPRCKSFRDDAAKGFVH